MEFVGEQGDYVEMNYIEIKPAEDHFHNVVKKEEDECRGEQGSPVCKIESETILIKAEERSGVSESPLCRIESVTSLQRQYEESFSCEAHGTIKSEDLKIEGHVYSPNVANVDESKGNANTVNNKRVNHYRCRSSFQLQ